jgi:hypothetical protein
VYNRCWEAVVIKHGKYQRDAGEGKSVSCEASWNIDWSFYFVYEDERLKKFPSLGGVVVLNI